MKKIFTTLAAVAMLTACAPDKAKTTNEDSIDGVEKQIKSIVLKVPLEQERNATP